MKEKSTNRLGRATFHHIATRSDVRPTAREVRWLKANLIVLWVFTSRSNEVRLLEMVAKVEGKSAASMFTQVVEAKTVGVENGLYARPWSRADGRGLAIWRA